MNSRIHRKYIFQLIFIIAIISVLTSFYAIYSKHYFKVNVFKNIYFIQPSIDSKNYNEISNFTQSAKTNSYWANEISRTYCKFPHLDPFDQSIMKDVFEPKKLNCDSKEYPLRFNSSVDSSSITFVGNDNQGFENCCYKFLHRKINPNTGELIAKESKKCTLITEKETKITTHHDAISVYCETKNISNQRFLIDIFPLIRKKPEIEKRLEDLKKSGAIDFDYDIIKQYNVVIIGIDAVSHMNFIRTLPKTHKYLLNDLNGIEMNGLVKIGEKTFPILVPALTGKFTKELENLCMAGLEDDYFDYCPFIWNNFKNKGFYTTYFEDAPEIGIFNYGKMGFKRNPTDYYFEPFFIKADGELGNNQLSNSNLCYGPRLAFEIMLDIVKKMAYFGGKDEKRRYFEFMWATSLTHDLLNLPKLGDEILLNTIKWMKQEGYLNNTVLILMSDHGIRWGNITNTNQGKIEGKMPFIYFVLPPKFRLENEQAVNNLKGNADALITHFDIYESLKDLTDLRRLSNYKLNMREKLLNQLTDIPRGISLFLPIPKTRTCSDAEIPTQFCVCYSYIPTNGNEEKDVKEGAKAIVQYVNDLLKEFQKCKRLFFKEILSSRKVLIDKPELKRKNMKNKDESLYELTISTIPGRGVFETLIAKESNSTWNVKNIIRTSLYGNDSYCVENTFFKNFCFCE